MKYLILQLYVDVLLTYNEHYCNLYILTRLSQLIILITTYKKKECMECN